MTLEEIIAVEGVDYSHGFIEPATGLPVVITHSITFSLAARDTIATGLGIMADDVPATVLSMIQARFG
jgi:hypothetical protein